jgi:hypothetical protein
MMSFDATPYFANIDEIECQSLLADWTWLLNGNVYSVFRATAMGDLILRDEFAAFHFLDMADGKIAKLADSEELLWELLADRNARKTLLFTFVVRGLREKGKNLGPGECYSPDHPLILGGELDDDNLQPCDIRVHASMQGQIHEQVRNLPPGTKISDIKLR